MRAAIITEPGVAPVVMEFPSPQAVPGAQLIDVRTTGLGGWDVLGAYRLGVQFPCVIRGEGVGFLADGRRVYFGERSVAPYGSWAEQTIVPEAEVWEVPDDIDDNTAIAMGIAGTGALIPLEGANIQPHETVLILGATGTLGQLALQFARYLGAAKVVAAGRNRETLERLKRRGMADEIVVLGGADDTAAHKEVAGEGYDVILDGVCGQPLLDSLPAARAGSRILTIGTSAGRQIHLDMAHLLFKSLSTVGTGQRPAATRHQDWLRLLQISRDISIELEYSQFDFADAAAAWQAQCDGVNKKIVATLR